MISIIIPVFNRAQYIGECLEGVFSQTYLDYEVIVVDDGSTDNLKDALAPYMHRIRYIYQNNGGVARARNTGIKSARGNYIAFLDSDDIWFPFKLKLQVKILSNLPKVGLVHTDFSHIDGKAKIISNTCARDFFTVLDNYGLTFNDLYPNRAKLKHVCADVDPLFSDSSLYWGDLAPKLIYGPMYLTSSTLIRKECIDRVGLLNETYVTAEDFDFIARIAKEYEVAFLDAPTLKYRRHDFGQLSSYAMQIETYKAWLNIAIRLWKEDGAFYAANKKLVNWRISHYYYALGTAYYSRKKYELAFENFTRSIKLNVKQKMVYLYTISSMLKTIFTRAFAEAGVHG